MPKIHDWQQILIDLKRMDPGIELRWWGRDLWQCCAGGTETEGKGGGYSVSGRGSTPERAVEDLFAKLKAIKCPRHFLVESENNVTAYRWKDDRFVGMPVSREANVR